MYVTEDFDIKDENTKMKLKKNSGLPKSTKPWKSAYSGSHVCGAGFTEAAAGTVAVSGPGASPVALRLGELVISILDSFHFDTPALK